MVPDPDKLKKTFVEALMVTPTRIPQSAHSVTYEGQSFGVTTTIMTPSVNLSFSIKLD